MHCYVGVDQSFSRFALVNQYENQDGELLSMHSQFYDFSAKTAGTGPHRLDKVYTTLVAYFRSLRQPAATFSIAYENYSFGSKFGREQMGEIGGILRLVLAQHFSREDLATVAPAAVKKYATGSGRAAKDDMKLAVFKKWDFTAATHDEADAYTLMQIARALKQPEWPELKYEKEVIEGVRSPKARSKKTETA